ncbi:hypothetical protein KIL84_019088, partial [Mauremys mutica]
MDVFSFVKIAKLSGNGLLKSNLDGEQGDPEERGSRSTSMSKGFNPGRSVRSWGL